MTAFKWKGDGNIEELSKALKAAFLRSGIPSLKGSDWRAVAFTVKLPGQLTPCLRARTRAD